MIKPAPPFGSGAAAARTRPWFRSIVRLRAISTLVGSTLVGSICVAQVRPAPSVGRPRPTPTPVSAPVPPTDVQDPLLAPPPTAPRVLASWHEALSVLRTQSPELLTAGDQVERARGQARVALAAVLPTVNATGSYTYQLLALTPAAATTATGMPASVLPRGAISGSITLAQPVVVPRAFYGLGTAARNVQVAQAAQADKRRTVAMTVADAMLATLAAERVAALNRNGLRAALERGALTRVRQQLGTGTLLDVERAEQDVLSARTQVVTGDEALRRSREALGMALGGNIATAAPGDLSLSEFERAVSDVCRSNAGVESRPEVAAARLRLSVAQRLVNDIWLQFAPTLTLQSQLSAADRPLYYGYPNTLWNLQAVLAVPLWDGGARYGARRDARAQVDQAAQALAQARIAAYFDIAQRDRAVSVTATARDFAQAQRDLASSIDVRTRDAYAKGLGTSLDLVTSGAALRQSDLNLAVLQLQAAQARVDAVLSQAECLY